MYETFNGSERIRKNIEELEFEKAEEIRQKLVKLEGFQAKSTIVNPSLNDVDVFSFLDAGERAFVNFIKVISGSVVQSHTMEFKKRMDESQEEILAYAISEVKSRSQVLSREIIVPFLPDVTLNQVKFTIPKLGDRKKLLELSERNLKFYHLDQQKQESIRNKVPRDERVLVTLQNDLRLSELPRHIECFDNSNIQGHFPVAACVVFINGKPAKREYRHFNIKTVEGPDDFASMEEIVYRRYKRLKEENLPLPQLIVVDGGKGQLGVAVKVLEELELYGKIAIIGIAKRLEEIFYPYDPIPLYLDKKSESLKVIQHLRNEAHRTARARLADGAGDVAVAARFAIGDVAQCLPHRLLKRRAPRRERQREALQPAREVVPKLGEEGGERLAVLPPVAHVGQWPARSG